MKFCDKLISLRREKGYSQEQLAQYLGVSRQSVSKWEADASMPELSKLVALSDFFQVSLDYLVKEEIVDKRFGKPSPCGKKDEGLGEIGFFSEKQDQILEKLEHLERIQKDSVREYEYISERRLFGLPLVHVHTSRLDPACFSGRHRLSWGRNDFGARAKGIIAIGNRATGIVSIGLASRGIFSLGLFSAGFFSVGMISAGLIAAGALAFGGLSVGAVAIGFLSLGCSAIGWYASGIAAVAKEVATGLAAVGKVAVGTEDVDGIHTLLAKGSVSREEVLQFITQYQPKLWGWVRWLLTFWVH